MQRRLVLLCVDGDRSHCLRASLHFAALSSEGLRCAPARLNAAQPAHRLAARRGRTMSRDVCLRDKGSRDPKGCWRWPVPRSREASQRRGGWPLHTGHRAASGPPGVRRSLKPEAAVLRYPACEAGRCFSQGVEDRRAASSSRRERFQRCWRGRPALPRRYWNPVGLLEVGQEPVAERADEAVGAAVSEDLGRFGGADQVLVLVLVGGRQHTACAGDGELGGVLGDLCGVFVGPVGDRFGEGLLFARIVARV